MYLFLLATTSEAGMSWKKFDDACPGCQPVILDMTSGVPRPLPDSSPAQQAAMRVWNRTTPEERAAFHRFPCLNSRAPYDVIVVTQFGERWREEMELNAPWTFTRFPIPVRNGGDQ